MVWKFEQTPFLGKRWGFFLVEREFFCELGMFVLDRIKILKMTHEGFPQHKDFNLEDLIGHRFKARHDQLYLKICRHISVLDLKQSHLRIY